MNRTQLEATLRANRVSRDGIAVVSIDDNRENLAQELYYEFGVAMGFPKRAWISADMSTRDLFRMKAGKIVVAVKDKA